MKRLSLCMFLILTGGLCFSQNRISGTMDLPQHTVRSFDKVSFEINYQVVDDRGTIRVNVSNPRVFAHPDSRYRYNGKWYTLQDLGLSSWPQNQQPNQFGVMLSASYPGGNVNHMFSCSSGNCRDNNDYIVRSVENAGKYKTSDFRVSYGGMMTYVGQPSPEVERLIQSKQSSGNSTASGQNPVAQGTSQGYTNPMSSGSSNRSGERAVQAVELAVGILGLFTNKETRQDNTYLKIEQEEAAAAEAERIRTEAEAARLAAAETERARAEAEANARIALISSRRSVFSPFSNGSIPRTLATTVSEVFFFFISHNPATLSSESFDLYISNVFRVKPNGDGSWPFTAQLLSDLAKINPNRTVALAGEFLNAETAEEKLAELKSRALANGLNVHQISYAGKNTDGVASDYWGTPATTPAKGAAPTEAKGQSDQDYWGNPVKTKSEPAIPVVKKAGSSPPATKANATPKADSSPKKVAVDYWGNPVKN